MSAKRGRALSLAMEIRALHELRGLSQRELAERMGTTRSSIGRLEGGNVSPSLAPLDKGADALEAESSVGFVDRNGAEPTSPAPVVGRTVSLGHR
jgi:transcriptional regulator with XRE-family HTH domain